MTTENNKWLLDVKTDPETGDGILEFPPELLERVGWVEGDVLVWTDLGDGTWSLTKKGEEG